MIIHNPEEALRNSDESIALCDEHGIMQERGWAMSFRGWAMGLLGRPEEGMALIRASIAEALDYSRKNTDISDDPIIYRMLGDLSLIETDADEDSMGSHTNAEHDDDREARYGAAEAYYRRSLEVAHGQGALSFELRAAIELGKLLRLQGRDVEAHEIVSRFRVQFTEGFETPDLVAADRSLGDAVPPG